MTVTIDLSASEEAQLTAAARQSGITPRELARKLITEHLPAVSQGAGDELDARLRQWQEQEGTVLMPDAPAKALFEEWAAEDANMTQEEREAEDWLWREIENDMRDSRATLVIR